MNSGQFMFTYIMWQASVAIDGCQSPIPPIAGRVGLYFEGSVSPALDGVSIRVIAMGTSNYVSLQKGDLAFETETGADGSFTAGPLYDDIIYNVEASKVSSRWYSISQSFHLFLVNWTEPSWLCSSLFIGK